MAVSAFFFRKGLSLPQKRFFSEGGVFWGTDSTGVARVAVSWGTDSTGVARVAGFWETDSAGAARVAGFSEADSAGVARVAPGCGWAA